jgi:protoporphyrinogen/coproporphyrinogen III oxidase
MKIAVLGGGVTGLSAAWRLELAGHDVRLFEASERLGGSVRTEISGDWLIEAGPHAVQESPEIAPIFDELGLGPLRTVANPAAKNRYIVRKGEIVALPTPSDVAGLISTPLLSFGSKLKVTSEVARSPRNRTEDVSVADLVRDHFGGEILERFVQPLIGGIYAGDAERLSTRHAFPKVWEAEQETGSLVRAAMDAAKKRKAAGHPPSSLVSFKGGLQALVDALSARLKPKSVLLGAEVRSLAPATGGRWQVEWKGPKGEDSGAFNRVVVALPAWALARIKIGAEGRKPLSGLGEIDYPPVATVFLGYRRDKVRHPLDGFGLLAPASEQKSVLGVIFSSSLFPGRTPEGHVALTAFVGGALQGDLALLPPKEIVERVRVDLLDLLGAEGAPAFTRHTLWKRAIPQYNLGYGLHLDSIAECEGSNPGLFFGGNARDGISLPDCLSSGASLAERVS